MKQHKKRWLSVVLTAAMLMSLFTGTAFAVEDDSVADEQSLNENTVATIGSQEYETLAAAIEAAGENGAGTEVVLQTNLSDVGTIRITNGKRVDLDLNNHEIGFKSGKRFFVQGGTLNLTGIGRMYEQSNYYAPVVICGLEKDSQETTVNVGSDVTLAGWSAIFVTPNENGNYGINITVSGTLESYRDTGNDPGAAVYVNGLITDQNGSIDIDLDGATLIGKEAGCSGMYLAGYAVTDIKNSIVTGHESGGSGIEIRAGELTISNSEITGGKGTYEGTPNGNGSTSSNAALAVVQHNTKRPIKVTIESGILTGTMALVQANVQNNNEDAVKLIEISVNDGSFNGTIFSEDKTEFITGGTFSDQSAKAYVVDGSDLVYNEGTGTYSLAPAETAVAQIGNAGFTTIAAAIEMAGDGETVTLLKPANENVVVPAAKRITLDLNGQTLTNVEGGKTHTITNNGILTVVDSSAEKTGKVDNLDHGMAAFYNEVGATATLSGGEFTRSRENGSSAVDNGGNSYYAIVNHGTMIIEDGVKVTYNGQYSSLLENGWYKGAENTEGKPSTLTIYGGTFSGGLNTIKNDDYGVLYIYGGTFQNTAQASLLNWNVAEIHGGTFESELYAVLNGYDNDIMDKGLLTICGGEFKSEDSVIKKMGGSQNSGTIQISGGNFTSGTKVFGDEIDGTVSVSGGTYSDKVPDAYLEAGKDTYRRANGTFTVAEGTEPGQTPSLTPTPGYTWALDEYGNYVEKRIYIPSTPTVQRPIIQTDDGASVMLSFGGGTATIQIVDGYELVDVTVNGVSKGAVTTLTGLKTGDVVVVTTQIMADPDEELIAKIKATQLIARSQMSTAKGKKAVKVYWFEKAGYELNFDGYEVYRSLKRYSGFGTKPIFTTQKETYHNTLIKAGTKYYYKVRGYMMIDGEKVYTPWSTKAWRTVR